MNLLIIAMSSATAPSVICKHAYNLIRCAASRREVLRITLTIGKWQEPYFRSSFKLENAKLGVVSVDIANDTLSRNLWHLQDLPILADNLAADIVHLSFPVPIRRSALRCPVVVSLHDLCPYDEIDNFGFPKLFFNRVFLRQCLNEVDCVACVSETTLSRLKVHFPRIAHKKAVVVHNCTTIQSNELMAPACERCQFVLMVAQHCANRNTPLAVEVFEELLQEGRVNKEMLLLLVGNHGQETTAIRSDITRRALEKRVKWVAGVNDGELRWLYENCEVLIVPSLIGGCDLLVVEGLLCGSRVVCPDIPAFREIGGKACHYFDLHAESRSSAMVTAVCKALAEPARPAERLDRFSIETVAREYANLYVRLREGALDVVEGEREVGRATN
jgi:glycosyltransferase involved in cell wall biosynthesis